MPKQIYSKRKLRALLARIEQHIKSRRDAGMDSCYWSNHYKRLSNLAAARGIMV